MRKNVFPITAGVFGSLAFASMGSLLVADTASADLTDVSIEASPFQHPDGAAWDTWRVVAHFDNLKDQIAAVVGPLFFFTGGGDMYNQAAFPNLPPNDFPSAAIGGEAYDSYVTIGATDFPHNVQFTPDFLGDWAGNRRRSRSSRGHRLANPTDGGSSSASPLRSATGAGMWLSLSSRFFRVWVSTLRATSAGCPQTVRPGPTSNSPPSWWTTFRRPAHWPYWVWLV